MKEQYFEYLDELRESGTINMFGAAPYLADHFGMDMKYAREIFHDWAKTFDPGKTPAERVKCL